MKRPVQAGHPGGISAVWRSCPWIALLPIVMAAAIAWRIADRPGTPALLPILAWQAAVWLPWVAYLYAIDRLARRTVSLPAPARALAHGVAALIVAASHLAWYWQVSSLASPLAGLSDTKFGVYAFFFVFWFLIDLLLYLAVLVALGHRERFAPPPIEAVATPATTVYAHEFAVRKGRATHVVRARDIQWIEAQGYYAALHTEAGQFLLRRSLARLESELDPERFVRIHRSTIVNVDNIAGIRTDGNGAVSVSLKQGDRRRVSRAGYRSLKTRLRSLD